MASLSETFDTDLEYARAQVTTLRTRFIEGGVVTHDEELGTKALEEIDVAEEELRAVEEELHARADEIAATREALDVERLRYRELFEMVPEAYLVTDLKGNVLEANRKCGVLFNTNPKHVAGKPLVSFVALPDRQRVTPNSWPTSMNIPTVASCAFSRGGATRSSRA